MFTLVREPQTQIEAICRHHQPHMKVYTAYVENGDNTGLELAYALAYGFVCIYLNKKHCSSTLKQLAWCHPVIPTKCRSVIIAYSPTGFHFCLFPQIT